MKTAKEMYWRIKYTTETERGNTFIYYGIENLNGVYIGTGYSEKHASSLIEEHNAIVEILSNERVRVD